MRVMPPPPQHSRIDLTELRSQISKRIGMERAQSYFGHLKGFLSRKLSKQEFDKLCLAALGRENLFLHNKLVNAVIKNAYRAKVPPLVGFAKDGKKPAVANNSSPSTSSPPVWSNGDVVLLPSPRKVRSAVRRIKDRPSPLGPNGRIDADARHLQVNGDFVHFDLKRPSRSHQGTGVEERSLVEKGKERSTGSGMIGSRSKYTSGVTAPGDGTEVELPGDLNSVRAGLQAPLGIPFCGASVGGARRPQNLMLDANDAAFNSCSYSGRLCDTHVLKERMDQIAEAQGLGGVTLDCANILNNGLDIYLKCLIRSCIDLAGARSVNEPMRKQVHKQQLPGKVVNGMWPGNHVQMQGGSGSVDDLQHCSRDRSISFLDFRVAMELNPRQLGEDWPLLLEKICLHSLAE